MESSHSTKSASLFDEKLDEEPKLPQQPRQYWKVNTNSLTAPDLNEEQIEKILETSKEIIDLLNAQSEAAMEGNSEKNQAISKQIQEKIRTLLIRDYKAYDPNTESGIAELWNVRETQEDALITELIAEFNNLRHQYNEPEIAIKNVFKMLQAAIKAHDLGYENGTTVISVINSKNKLLVGNLGDSTALLVHLDKNGNYKNTIHLNPYLHSAKNKEEKERLDKVNNKSFAPASAIGEAKFVLPLKDKTLSISTTGGLGDRVFEKIGYTYEPKISDYNLNKLPNYENGDQLLLVVACDGLTERDCLNFDADPSKENQEKNIGFLISQGIKAGLNLTDITTLLATKAKENGSKDNITTILTKVELNPRIAKLVAVFDGHRGMDVSQFVAKFYAPYLKIQIQLQMIKSLDSKLANKIESIINNQLSTITNLNVLSMFENKLKDIMLELQIKTYNDTMRDNIVDTLKQFVFIESALKDTQDQVKYLHSKKEIIDPHYFQILIKAFDKENQANLLRAQKPLNENNPLGLKELRRSIDDRNKYLQNLFQMLDVIFKIPLHKKTDPHHVQAIMTLHQSALALLQNKSLLSNDQGMDILIAHIKTALDETKKDRTVFETIDSALSENTIFKLTPSTSAESLLKESLQQAIEIQKGYQDYINKAIQTRKQQL